MDNLLKLRDIYTFYACVHIFKVTKMNISPSLQSDLNLQIIESILTTRVVMAGML